MNGEEWVEIPIKELLPSKKAQKNYNDFFNKINELQKKEQG